MIFCITGIDCSGKSTLINNLIKEINNVIWWHWDYPKDLSGKILAGKHLRSEYLANNNIIAERIPYIEDIVYSEILEGKKSVFEDNWNYLDEIKDYFIIRLTADRGTLIKRLEARGDNYINLNQLDLIQAKYDSVLKQFSNVITINTSNISEKELTNQVVKLIKSKITMKIGNILPWSATKLIKGKPFHMCLAHLMKKYPEYKEFYKQEVKDGSFVLMDNGEYEKSILTNDELIELYNEVQPSEIVLPDDIQDPKASIEKTVLGYLDIRDKLNYRPSYLVVPHGDCIDDICVNLAKILGKMEICLGERINIGIGKLLISGESRKLLVDRISEMLDKYWFTRDSKIHLLGCVETLDEMKDIFNNYWRVRSFDSSLPTIFTFAGMTISRYSKRPEMEMNWDRNNFCKALLKQNIEEMEKIIND